VVIHQAPFRDHQATREFKVLGSVKRTKAIFEKTENKVAFKKKKIYVNNVSFQNMTGKQICSGTDCSKRDIEVWRKV